MVLLVLTIASLPLWAANATNSSTCLPLLQQAFDILKDLQQTADKITDSAPEIETRVDRMIESINNLNEVLSKGIDVFNRATNIGLIIGGFAASTAVVLTTGLLIMQAYRWALNRVQPSASQEPAPITG